MHRERRPYNCRRCQNQVAETDGIDLFFGDKPVPMNPLKIMFICPHCRAEVRWQATVDKKALQSQR